MMLFKGDLQHKTNVWAAAELFSCHRWIWVIVMLGAHIFKAHCFHSNITHAVLKLFYRLGFKQ